MHMSKQTEEEKRRGNEESPEKSPGSARGSVLEEDESDISTSLMMQRKHRDVFSRETYQKLNFNEEVKQDLDELVEKREIFMSKVNPKLYGDLKDWKNQPLFVKESEINAAEMTAEQWKLAEEEEAWEKEKQGVTAFVESPGTRSPSR